MNYIVLDFEYNQPFNFEKNEKGKVVQKCPFEIIQIGAVKLDEQLNIVDVFNEYIKPKVYRRMHPFVEKITHISNKMLKGSDSFTQIYPKLLNFFETEYVLCFWGNNDLKELYRNANYYSFDYKELPNKFINVQTLAASVLKIETGRTIGLKNAVEAFNIETDSEFHDALNDAFYTAKVFKILKIDMAPREILNSRFLSKNKEKNYKIDTGQLYKEAEKDFGRLLTKQEKKIVKKFYELGKAGIFDN